VPATFFVTTSHIHHGVADPTRMSVDQLKDLLRCGMTIGSHSRTHPNLLEVTEAQAREEIAGSKTDLEQALGTRVDLFAYPYGAHHRVQVDLVRNAGYSAAFSAGGGAQNTRLGMFWLFRFGLSPDMDGPEDRQAFAPLRGTLRGLYRDLRKRLGYPLLAAINRSKS
jgi:peptidoglycan/xylan/chitin deacetylase (PgdA/CDA1 family)